MRRARAAARGASTADSAAWATGTGAVPAPSARSWLAADGRAARSPRARRRRPRSRPPGDDPDELRPPAPRPRPSPCRSRSRRRLTGRDRVAVLDEPAATFASSIERESWRHEHRGHATRRSTAATTSSAPGRPLDAARRARDRHVEARDALDRRVEVVERLLHAARRDLGTEAAASCARRGRRRAASSCAASRRSCPGRAARSCAGRSPRSRSRARRAARRPRAPRRPCPRARRP